MLCERHFVFNEGLEVLTVGHHVLYRLLPQMQVTPWMSLQLISKSSEQTVSAGQHEKQKLDSLRNHTWSSQSSCNRKPTHTRLQAPLGVWDPEPEAGWKSWRTPLHLPLLEVCSFCPWPEPGGPPARLSSSPIHISCFPLWAFQTVSLTWWCAVLHSDEAAVYLSHTQDLKQHSKKFTHSVMTRRSA